MANLTTKYLGLKLKNPLIVSASPLSASVANIVKLEEAGASAIVLPSLFEEQIELRDIGVNNVSQADQNMLPDALKHIPEMQEYNRGASGYLALIYQAKKQTSVPIIASLNGYYSGGWVQYARLLAAAGADALELNIYHLASKPHISGQEVEQMYLNLVRNVRSSVNLPIAVKISPYFSAMTHMAVSLAEAGTDGLVLFNRFYQPDIDIETEAVVPSLSLSHPSELRLRLRWAAILSGHTSADLAITGGVHTAEDVVKSIMVGGKVVMMASVLLRNGIDHLQTIHDELNQWLDAHQIESLDQIRGKLSQQHVTDPAAFERANYMNVLKESGGIKL